jgi:hypothetical protein
MIKDKESREAMQWAVDGTQAGLRIRGAHVAEDRQCWHNTEQDHSLHETTGGAPSAKHGNCQGEGDEIQPATTKEQKRRVGEEGARAENDSTQPKSLPVR